MYGFWSPIYAHKYFDPDPGLIDLCIQSLKSCSFTQFKKLKNPGAEMTTDIWDKKQLTGYVWILEPHLREEEVN